MATVLPPPSKRQKLEAVEKVQRAAEDATIPSELGNVRVQFVDQGSGQATGPVVAVQVKDTSIKNLETLLNTLQAKVSLCSCIKCYEWRKDPALTGHEDFQ